MPILANCNDRRQDMAARARNSAAAPAAERELIIRRTFDAPRALVFRVWTEPQHLAQWSCPRGFTMTENSGELRVGGAFAACMRSPEGSDHRLRGVYREIDRKSTRLNSSHSQISYAVFCLKKKNNTIASFRFSLTHLHHPLRSILFLPALSRPLCAPLRSIFPAYLYLYLATPPSIVTIPLN